MRKLLSCLITGLLFCQAGWSQQKSNDPISPAARQLSEFLRAYNTGDLKVLSKFIAEHFDESALEMRSAEERAQTGVATFDITRQLKLHGSKQTNDYKIAAFASRK